MLERQYRKYLDVDITDKLKETQSARTHNIAVEEVMGMFSTAKQRVPKQLSAFCLVR